MKKLRLNNAGDTIVEVMISLAILAGAFGMSYATANKALQESESANEHSIATKLLQAQIEKLRYVASNSNSVFQQGGGKFCINPSNQIAYGGCKYGPGNMYDVSLRYINPSTNTFRATVTWGDITGHGNDTVIADYRIHPKAPTTP